jgi:hypothetical protein
MVVDGRTFARGHRVVLRPEANRNAQDHLLDGRSATIERIYVDYDDQVHLCVTVDDDPGQDIMRDIGRYLYFKPTRWRSSAHDATFEKQILSRASATRGCRTTPSAASAPAGSRRPACPPASR